MNNDQNHYFNEKIIEFFFYCIYPVFNTWGKIQLLMLTKIAIVFALAILFHPINPLQLRLERDETCFDYRVDENSFTKVFYFHYNHNIDLITMAMFKKGNRLPLDHSGEGIDYKNNMKVVHPQKGQYMVCFEKKTPNIADISFDIIDEENVPAYAGKEELAKTSRRISEFLMDIKRVGFTFRHVLEQHNSRSQKMRTNQNSHGFMLFIKILVMVGIVSLQIFAVKKIFN